MSITSAPWRKAIGDLRHEPEGSFRHWLGDALAAADDDQALTLLVEIVVEDPCDTPEYKIAAEMIHHLFESEAAAS